MRVCSGQSVGWTAEALKWLLRRPRLCWSQTGDPLDIQRLYLVNTKSLKAGASSTWEYSWIGGLASANTFRLQRIKSSNVELT